ncbi:MAG: hypothetical protein K1000chlam2_01179 [Chlamydiae bacterium]|nr:hypothetical protein [Chlamydiota bacterium]
MKKNARLFALTAIIGSFAFTTGCNSNSNGTMDSGKKSSSSQQDQTQDMQKKHSDSMQDTQQEYSPYGDSSSSSDAHQGGCN